MNKYKIKITGKNPYYFLTMLLKLNIKYYDLTINDKNLIILVNDENYKKISKIKTSYKKKIIKIYGPKRIIQFIKINKYSLIFFLFGVIINIILSNLIFNIEIVHPNEKLKEKIILDLKEKGISKYKFKKNYKERQKILNQIKAKENKYIDWIEIEEHGTKYIVNIEERKIKKNNLNNQSRNIVAKKSAVIIDIKAETGEIVKKKNDYVVKGEKIISGEIHNKEQVVSYKKAIGKVYGETWYSVKIELPNKCLNKSATGRSKYGIEMSFINKNIKTHIPFKEYNKNIIFSLYSKILPINFSLNKYYEITTNYKQYNDKILYREALKYAENKLKKRLTNQDFIMSKKVLKKEQINSKIILDIFFKVKEDITAYELIKEEKGEIK